MPRPSRRRVLQLAGSALPLSLTGCFGNRPDRGGVSPTDATTAPPTTERTGDAHTSKERTTDDVTDSPTASESPHDDPATEREATHAPEDTSSPTETERSPDCSFSDIGLYNRTDRTVDVSARLVEGRKRTTTDGVGLTPTETPREAVWTASTRLAARDGRSYEDVPDREGPHRLTVDVEDGPRETAEVRGEDWEDNRFIDVTIEENDIRFARLHSDPPTGC